MIRLPLIALLSITWIQAQPVTPRRAQPIDGFAAEVDGTVITVGDVMQRVRPTMMALRGRVQGEAMVREQSRIFQEGLDQLIEEQLMLAKFRKLGAELPPGVVRERAELVMRERFEGDRLQFQQALAATGKTEQEWRDELREQLIIQSMTQQYVTSSIHLAPREVRDAFESRKSEFVEPVELELRAIAFRPASGEDMELQGRKVAMVLERLEQGESFGEVAKTFSEGPKRDEGGYQGWVKIEALPEPLPATLGTLQPGDRTGLVVTPFQSYIFEVLARRGGQGMTIAEAQPQLERDLRETKFEEAYEAWIRGLRSEFQIQRFTPDISAVTGDQ